MRTAKERIVALLFPAKPNGEQYATTNASADAFDRIADHIDGKPGDPGKMYPIDERVRRVVGALQARARR